MLLVIKLKFLNENSVIQHFYDPLILLAQVVPVYSTC